MAYRTASILRRRLRVMWTIPSLRDKVRRAKGHLGRELVVELYDQLNPEAKRRIELALLEEIEHGHTTKLAIMHFSGGDPCTL